MSEPLKIGLVLVEDPPFQEVVEVSCLFYGKRKANAMHLLFESSPRRGQQCHQTRKDESQRSSNAAATPANRSSNARGPI